MNLKYIALLTTLIMLLTAYGICIFLMAANDNCHAQTIGHVFKIGDIC